MDMIGGIPVGLAAHLREAVVSLGPEGTVEWANDAALELLGLDADALVGTSALDRLHPDEVARALDGIAFSAMEPDRTAVVPFRIRRGDDSWLHVELRSSVVSSADGDHLVLVLRDASPRRAVAEALGLVAAGAPLDDVAPCVARVVEARWPGVVAAVLLDDEDGRRLLGDDHWDERLRAHVLPSPSSTSSTSSAWWQGALGAEDVTIVDPGALPAEVAEAATAAGVTTFAAAPVRVAAGTAVLVAWFDRPEAALMEFEHASVELRELLGLAIERRAQLRQLDRAARHDPLTGLLNRGGFVELADQLVAGDEGGAGDLGRRRVALLYIDLDGFKPVNDRFGHAVGDAVLRIVAQRLQQVGDGWTPARIGGDEFVLVGRGGDEIEAQATALAQAAVAAIGEPIRIADEDGDRVQVVIGASVGVAVAAASTEDVHRLLEHADGAMYAVKSAGGRAWSARLPG